MRIGYRANEGSRVKKMLEKCNKDGLLEFEGTFEKHTTGRHTGNNKWETIAWQKPVFKLLDPAVYRDDVEEFWEDKPVRFAEMNNCVGCFHRNPMLLNLQSQKHPEKMNWFASQEGGGNGQWRSDTTYKKIINLKPQIKLSFDDFTSCDSGYCGI